MKNKKLTYTAIIIIICISTFYIWRASNTQLSKPVKVAVVMPMSGDLGMFGQNVLRGVEIALKQSGLSTSTVEIIPEDTEGYTSGSVLFAWKKAVEIDHADIVVGPFGPGNTLIVAPTLPTSTTMTVISVSNCDERFKQYQTIFCVYPSITDQVVHAIDFMKKKGWKNVYFLTENSEFGILVEEVLRAHSNDINLVGVEKIVANQTRDLRTNISKMVSAKPDVVYSMLGAKEGFTMLRQYPLLAKEIPLYIGTDVNKEQMQGIFGQRAPGIYFPARLSEFYNQSFVEMYKNTYNSDPDYFAAIMHSALTVVFDDLKKGGAMEKLSENIVNKKVETTGVSGFSFRQDRTVEVPLHTYRFERGDFVQE
jgi:ABC-type branched-subunit amino acid transport system substrate-binding protein